MSFGLGFRVGPFYIRQPLRAGASAGSFLKLPLYVLLFAFVLAWSVIKWTALGAFVACRWLLTTLVPAVRDRWAARQAQQLAPPAT